MTTGTRSAFEQYHTDLRIEISDQKRSARRNTKVAHGISITLIAAGAAVAFSGITDELSGVLNATLGFLVVLTEGLSRTFKPADQAAHARRLAQDLEHEAWLYEIHAPPYQHRGHDSQCLFFENVDQIRRTGAEGRHLPPDVVKDAEPDATLPEDSHRSRSPVELTGSRIYADRTQVAGITPLHRTAAHEVSGLG